MCGYLNRRASEQTLREYYDSLRIPLSWPKATDRPDVEHMYPAFGANASRQITDMVIRGDDINTAVNATWWFDCSEVEGRLVVGSRTTFNARNLSSPYWKGAIRHHRGAVAVTGLGESKMIDGKKHQYLMTGDEPFLVGTVYRAFPNGLYSCAVITRDSQPGFDKYHDKAFPLFLPADKYFIELWLADVPESDPVIAQWLANPGVTVDLTVQEVKTFKDSKPIGVSERLLAVK